MNVYENEEREERGEELSRNDSVEPPMNMEGNIRQSRPARLGVRWLDTAPSRTPAGRPFQGDESSLVIQGGVEPRTSRECCGHCG
jgi:hypothetical protein